MEIQLLGASPPTNPLLLVLAAHHPRLLPRDEVLHLAYGSSASPEARNRFRVALARLRRTAPLIESEKGVGLDPARVTTDLVQVRHAIEQARREPDFSTELALWGQLLPRLGSSIASDLPALDDLRTAWTLEATEAIQSALAAADQAHDPRLLLAAAEAGLAHFPFDEAFWQAFMRASEQLGDASAAKRVYAAARKKAREEGEALPPEIESPEPPPFNDEQQRSLLAWFDRILAEEPDLALQMLASPSLRPELLRAPTALLPLLQEALRHQPPASEARERVQLRIVTGLALSHQDAEVIRAAEDFLRTDPSPFRQSIAQLHLSFAYAETGRFEEAFAAIDASIALAEEYGQPIDSILARGQRASLLLVRAEFPAAESALRSSIEALNAIGTLPPEYNAVVLRQNLALAVAFQERLEEAETLLRESELATQEAHIEGLLRTADSLLGWLAFRRGECREGVLRYRRSLRRAYRANPKELLATLAFLSHGIRQFAPDIAHRAAALAHHLQQSLGNPHRPMHALLLPQAPPHSTANLAQEVREILNALPWVLDQPF